MTLDNCPESSENVVSAEHGQQHLKLYVKIVAFLCYHVLDAFCRICSESAWLLNHPGCQLSQTLCCSIHASEAQHAQGLDSSSETRHPLLTIL